MEYTIIALHLESRVAVMFVEGQSVDIFAADRLTSLITTKKHQSSGHHTGAHQLATVV